MIDDDVIIKYDITLKEVYDKKVEKDGWLYLKLSLESWYYLNGEPLLRRYQVAGVWKLATEWETQEYDYRGCG